MSFPNPGQGRKKKSKLEKILRQDHSDVYFENDRLNDELSHKIDGLHKERHKHEMQRAIEIEKLKREIIELKAIKEQTERQTEAFRQLLRPHTTKEGASRRRNLRSSKPTKSSKPRTYLPEITDTIVFDPKIHSTAEDVIIDITGFEDQTVAEKDGYESIIITVPGEDCPDEVFYTQEEVDGHLPEVRPRPKAAKHPRTKSEPKKPKHSEEVGTHIFKEESGKFPAEWYKQALPASDACLIKVRREARKLKSAPHMLRSWAKEKRDKMKGKDEKSKENHQRSVSRVSFAQSELSGSEEKMSLVCEEPVKPILMSLKRLKEITYIDNITERGPSRNTQRKQDIKIWNEIENEKVDAKVKMFCRDLDEQKIREIELAREREEQRRNAAQDAAYFASLSAHKK